MLCLNADTNDNNHFWLIYHNPCKKLSARSSFLEWRLKCSTHLFSSGVSWMIFWVVVIPSAFLSLYVVLPWTNAFSLLAAETKWTSSMCRMIKNWAIIPCIVFMRLAIGLIWFSIMTVSMERNRDVSKAFRIAMPISTRATFTPIKLSLGQQI